MSGDTSAITNYCTFSIGDDRKFCDQRPLLYYGTPVCSTFNEGGHAKSCFSKKTFGMWQSHMNCAPPSPITTYHLCPHTKDHSRFSVINITHHHFINRLPFNYEENSNVEDKGKVWKYSSANQYILQKKFYYARFKEKMQWRNCVLWARGGSP